ncbi:MAG: GAF domain-containing protein, partial [Anaerolineae bacterium]|nr:GAF domain-containing protein [Anaerolineae bacterium]
MNADNFYLALCHPNQEEYEIKLILEDGRPIFYDLPKDRKGNGPTDWIIRNRQPLLVDEQVGEVFQRMGFDMGGRNAESWLGVPMLRGDEVIGVIGVQSFNSPRVYGPHQLDLLSAVANQASITIDNARRFQQSQARARREQLLREITTRVHSSSDADTIMRTAVREISTALDREAFIKLSGSKKQTKSLPQIPEEASMNSDDDPQTDHQNEEVD